MILTGATGGIGRHVARAPASCGARVGLADIQSDEVSFDRRNVKSRVLGHGDAFDTSNPDDFQSVPTARPNRVGRDNRTWVDSAGLWESKRFEDVSRMILPRC